MQPSAKCVAAIKQWEGCRLQVYDDLNGYPTVGYGHKLQPGEAYPNGITQDTADQLFAQDTAPLAARISAVSTWTQGQFDALVSFAYNLGFGNMKMMLAHGAAQVPSQLVLWVHAGGRVQPGLVARRAQEVVWWNS